LEVQKSLLVAAIKKDVPLSSSPSGKVNKRRKEVLNALFMRHITDHMSTSDLLGFDIQITNVKYRANASLNSTYFLYFNI